MTQGTADPNTYQLYDALAGSGVVAEEGSKTPIEL